MSETKATDEAHDLTVLRAAIQQRKLSAFDYLAAIARYGIKDLENSGYRGKTNAEAMALAFADAQRDVKKLTDAHVKKWPD